MPKPILTIKNLSKKYGENVIFQDLSLTVNEGDTIAELEAMKMKVPVVATCSGTVSSIAVAVGDAVERGQILLTLS